jgi:hypothetical protein
VSKLRVEDTHGCLNAFITVRRTRGVSAEAEAMIVEALGNGCDLAELERWLLKTPNMPDSLWLLYALLLSAGEPGEAASQADLPLAIDLTRSFDAHSFGSLTVPNAQLAPLLNESLEGIIAHRRRA